MVLTLELAEGTRLLTGLKNRVYQLAILHEYPNDAVFNAASQAVLNRAKDKITAGFREE